MKICPVGAELLHTGGQTDGRTGGTRLIVASFFFNFANAPENIECCTVASLCHGQQYKLYVPVFENILQLICTLFTRCILTLH